MDILLGTTNLSKLKRFSELLECYDARLMLPSEWGIHTEPEETGSSPRENAELKAAFYSRYFDPVICCDSGMLILDLDQNDPRQPGLHIRAPRGVRLNDDEMIAYYAALARSLGGRMACCYLDGVAVCCQGTISGYSDINGAQATSLFYIVDQPHADRHPGWPLDSLSVNARTGAYYMDESIPQGKHEDEKYLLSGYRERLTAFIVNALSLKKK